MNTNAIPMPEECVAVTPEPKVVVKQVQPKEVPEKNAESKLKEFNTKVSIRVFGSNKFNQINQELLLKISSKIDKITIKDKKYVDSEFARIITDIYINYLVKSFNHTDRFRVTCIKQSLYIHYSHDNCLRMNVICNEGTFNKAMSKMKKLGLINIVGDKYTLIPSCRLLNKSKQRTIKKEDVASDTITTNQLADMHNLTHDKLDSLMMKFDDIYNELRDKNKKVDEYQDISTSMLKENHKALLENIKISNEILDKDNKLNIMLKFINENSLKDDFIEFASRYEAEKQLKS